MTWRAISEPFTSDLNREVRGLYVNGRSQLAAWGSEAGGGVRRALLWTSADGAQWRTTVFDPSLEDSLVVDVANGPLGYVAVGWNSLSRAAWWSDDGELWTSSAFLPPALPEDGSLDSVAAGSEGFLAVGGTREAGGRAAAWFSPTGEEWTLVGAELPKGYFADVTRSSDGGFVAVGVDKSGGDWSGTVWVVSPDGLAWRVVASEALATTDDDALYLVTSLSGGYAAYGQITPQNRRNCPDCDLNPEYWRAYTSIDGSDWERSVIQGDPGGPGSPLPATSPTDRWGDGLIAVGPGDDRSRHLWRSADGVTWSTVGDPIVLPLPDERFAEVWDVLASERYLVIGGSLGRAGYVAITTVAP